MRDIIFRGKRLDKGEWVEGAFLNDRDGAFYICPAVTDISYGDNGNRRRIGCWHKVDPATVGQYTGLTDKNGKRIFEGDVVRYTERKINGSDVPCTHAVEYAEGGWCVDCWFLNNWLRDGKNGNIQLEDIEVIGTVYDNPELLEGGEQ